MTVSKPSLDEPGTIVTKPKYLAHVVLSTTGDNFAEMVTFYKTFLDAHPSYENDFISFLTYDHEHHRIAIVAAPGTIPKAPKSAGLRHIAFAFDSLNDLALAYLQRKAHGILPSRCLNHGVTTSIYYRDPDDNELETQVDNFDTVQEMVDYMASPDFAENPIGVDFDPEQLVARIKSGESDASIKIRPNIGKRKIA
jgi:catechol-2,3-dioxygenase